MLLDDDLARPRDGAVHHTITLVVGLALLATLAVLAAGPNVAWARYDGAEIPELVFRSALAIGFVTAIVCLWLPARRTSYSVRFAVALPIVHLVAMVFVYVAWRALRDNMHGATHSMPLFDVLPLDVTLGGLAIAIATGGLVVARQCTREWLHASAMLALVYLLTLGLWLPIAAHHWDGDAWTQWLVLDDSFSRPTHMLVFVLAPPLAVAMLVTAIAQRRPHVLRHPVTLIAVAVAAISAVAVRANASGPSALVYINFMHVLVAAAAIAIAALVALGIASWTGVGRARRALAETTLAGTVSGVPGETVAALEMRWLRGPSVTASAFSVNTPHGELPVPPGAQVVVPTPLGSTLLRGGDALAILRAGDRVVLAGYERGADAGPFRASAAPVPGARGVRVGLLGAERYGLHHVALDLWRPSIAYLLIGVVVSLPALAALLSDRL